MALDTIESVTVNEGGSMIYTGLILLKEDGTPILLADIQTATLTLYDVLTKDDVGGGIINDRDDQDVKNANQVTIGDSDGVLTWGALPADTPIVGAPDVGELEYHVGLFQITYTGGAINHPFEHYVKQLNKVP